MSTWRVQQHYGFGAARIPLAARARHVAPRAGLRDGLATIASELFDGGPGAAARRMLADAPAIALGVLLCAGFLATLLRDHADKSPVEVVLIPAEPVAEEPAPAPVVEPIVARVEPPAPPVVAEPEPVPEARPEQLPPPPPVEIAKRLEPVVEPKLRPRPKPALPTIARVEPPPPAPRLERSARRPPAPAPAPVARPQLAMDRVTAARAEAPAPLSARPARAPLATADAERLRPTIEAPAAPAPDPPAPSSAAEPSFRVAETRPRPGDRSKPAAMPALAPSPAPEAVTAPSSAGSRPERVQRATAPPPSRAIPASARRPTVAAVDVPTSPSRAPVPARTERALPRARSLREAPRPTAALARAPVGRAPAPPAPIARTSRSAPAAPARVASEERPGIAGVPLGELAACVSDREEDRLKQAVVAAVKTQEQCVSRKGTYRFVETRNLNAFLMWIDRRGTGTAGDRCDELRNALECLQQAGLRAAGR